MMSTEYGAIPRFAQLDYAQLWQEFPPAPDFMDGVFRLSRDEIRALQERRFLREIARGWRIPFYQKLWARNGVTPGDVKSLDDLSLLPIFSVHDLTESIATNPPWGELVGIDPEHHAPVPLLLQTSGGTTGLPRAMLYTPRDREVMRIVTGRRMIMQGVRPFDLVQVALATGLQNAGLLMREALSDYTGAVPIISGTGNQTPTRRQIELMRGWKVNYFAAGGGYLRHVASVARDEMGFDVRELKLKGLLSWLGAEPRDGLEAMWGTDVFDNYGANEFGTIAAECRAKSGLHIFEDVFVTELLGSDGAIAGPGGKGSLIVTTLFKYAAPMIRFNTNDLFFDIPGQCPCGGTHRRVSGMQGRADNMVKFRGTSVFPEAIGALIAAEPGTTGEFICILEPTLGSGRERLRVLVEVQVDADSMEQFRDTVVRRLKEGVGVTLDVELVAPGALRELTLTDTQTKPRRLIDRNKELAG